MKTKYEQVAERLEARIRSGEFASGGFLPGERVLAGQLGVGRVTVRSGTAMLVRQRLIEPVNGHGFKVILGTPAPAKPKTGLIGGVFAGACGEGESPSSIMAGQASSALQAHGYHLLFASSNLRLDRELRTIRDILDKGVDGLVVVPVYRKQPDRFEFEEHGNHAGLLRLRESGIPIVLADRSYAASGIPCVCNDDEAGGYLAAKYLLDRGHRQLLVYMGAWDRVGRQRIKGCRRAAREAGARLRLHAIADPPAAGNFTVGIEDTRAMIESLDGATGIVTSGKFARQIAHLAGAGACRGRPALEWIGYDVPPDASDPHAPPFAYVKRPLAEIGRRAALKALALAHGAREAATEEYVAPEIVHV